MEVGGRDTPSEGTRSQGGDARAFYLHEGAQLEGSLPLTRPGVGVGSAA